MTIAMLYRGRGRMELFFKWIKQHLRIKRFFGTSPHVAKMRIWIAVSAYVLVAMGKKRLAPETKKSTLDDWPCYGQVNWTSDGYNEALGGRAIIGQALSASVNRFADCYRVRRRGGLHDLRVLEGQGKKAPYMPQHQDESRYGAPVNRRDRKFCCD